MLIPQNCSLKTDPLTPDQINQLLTNVPHWQHDAENRTLTRECTFASYTEGLAFAQAVGTMAEAQNHHPDLHIYYKKCVVEYTTHTAKGLSINDFICAAKVDQIVTELTTR